MKKNILLYAGLLFTTCLSAQNADPVIMTIDGKDITRSEFEYSYNKNNADGVLDKKGIEDYVPLFVNFKLKVAAAEDARIDTLTRVKKELDGYREQMLMPYLVDTAYIENMARQTYENTKKRFDGMDLLTASHILVLVRQNATKAEEDAAKQRIDSIYNALQAGGNFEELAKQCSDDKGSAARGGSLGQFGKGMMIPDFEAAANALKVGEISKPVRTTVGYHIIKLTDRHPFESYEFHHDNIVKFLESRGIKDVSARMALDSLVKKSNGKTRQEVVDAELAKIEMSNPEVRNLAREYRDGTLMYEVSKINVWDKAAGDEKALEKQFSKNKKKYAWDEPRFKGFVIHAKNDSVMNKVKQAYDDMKEEEWLSMLKNDLMNDSVKLIRMERGLYKSGDNQYVDFLVFKTGKEASMKAFPVTMAFGETMKKPKSYKDVKGQVTTDLQNKLESEWVEELKKKYSVKVYDDVLSTVNKH